VQIVYISLSSLEQHLFLLYNCTCMHDPPLLASVTNSVYELWPQIVKDI
jgi:hypothetical protein